MKNIVLLILTGTLVIYRISVSAQNYEWAYGIGGPGDQSSMDMAMDNQGNVYLIGNLQGTNIDFDPGPGTAFLNSAGGTDIFYARYSLDATGIENPEGETGMDVILDQSYPNPAYNKATIVFSLFKEEHIKLKFSNLLGKEIKMIMNEVKEPGRYLVETDVRDLGTGIYFYSITSNDVMITRKIVVVK